MQTALTFYLMKMPEVEKACAIKKSQIYKLIQQHKFPVPVKLGQRARAWKSCDIQDWINNRPIATHLVNEDRRATL